MFIQTRNQADPLLMLFIPGEAVLPPGSERVDEAQAAETSPLARRLLKVDGIAAVSLGLDELMVRRDSGREWYILKPSVLGAIMEHYASGEPVLADPVVMKVLDLIDDRIRPAIGAYGGEIFFKGYGDGTLTLELIGGGGSRKQSMVANIVTHHVPEVSGVEWIGDAPRVPDRVFTEPLGPEAEAVLRLLDEKVNPAVAAHGGRIDLVNVVDCVAYVRMEGGCQGCSASAATLQQGVRNAIMTEVPAIQGVVDLTDHGAGANPFYR